MKKAEYKKYYYRKGWYARPRSHSYHRQIRTTNERRATVGFHTDLRYDPDMNYKMKKRRHNYDTGLPNNWDDLHLRHEKKSWKRITRRKKQWKPK